MYFGEIKNKISALNFVRHLDLMKLKLHHMFFAFGIAFLAPSVVAYGQDVVGAPSYDSYDPESDRERERVIYSPGENTEVPTITTTRAPETGASWLIEIWASPVPGGMSTSR